MYGNCNYSYYYYWDECGTKIDFNVKLSGSRSRNQARYGRREAVECFFLFLLLLRSARSNAVMNGQHYRNYIICLNCRLDGLPHEIFCEHIVDDSLFVEFEPSIIHRTQCVYIPYVYIYYTWVYEYMLVYTHNIIFIDRDGILL